ncbi:MAG: VOC family protein [Elusimicrobia bacterium]|nr:VOC family protein [Elusimicrobiota bacterium]
MKLGYVLLYVEDPLKTVEFYEKAFGLSRGFVHESNTYAEMDSGATKLGFVAISLAQSNKVKFAPVKPNIPAPGIEIGLVTDSVDTAFRKAIEAGAVEVLKPTKKPWGQLVSYVRDCNGFLVELCSPMG